MSGRKQRIAAGDSLNPGNGAHRHPACPLARAVLAKMTELEEGQ